MTDAAPSPACAAKANFSALAAPPARTRLVPVILRAGMALALVSLISACGAGVTAPVAAPSLPPPDEDTCGATPYGRLIGQDATALERELIMRQVRVIRPGMAVTMDFRPERINFEIDDANRIVRIYCG